MKHGTALSGLTAAMLASFEASSADARDAVIVLSPYGTAEEKKADIESVTNYLLKEIDPGETAWLVNGMTQEQIAEYHIASDMPEDARDRAKMRANPAFFRGAKLFFDGAKSSGEDSFPGQIDLPTLLRGLHANYPATEARDLILYNVSPVNHDPRSDDQSMLGGVVPDDDTVLSSRAHSVYGSAGEESFLKNYVVHWDLNGVDWSVSDRHEQAMMRYVSLAITSRSGTLASVARNPETALRNASNGVETAIGPFTPKTDGHTAMVHFQPHGTHDGGQLGVSIFERDLSARPADPAVLRSAENVEIAVRWSCACDLDLAMQPWGGEILSFRNVRTSFGVLFKDVVTGGANGGWESALLHGPIDLTSLTVAVNHYSGGKVEGEFRVSINGVTWASRLRFEGANDSGVGLERTMTSRLPANDAWQIINIAEVLGRR